MEHAGIHNAEEPDKSSIPRVPGGRRRTSYYNRKNATTSGSDAAEAGGGHDAAEVMRRPSKMPSHLEARRASSVPPVDLNTKIETRNRRPALYNTCAPILEKDPHLRTDAECRTVLDMLKYNRFLKPLSVEQQVDLCRVMRLQDVPFAGEDIVKQGEEGKGMYIILVGSFSVSIEEDSRLDSTDLEPENDNQSKTSVSTTTGPVRGPSTIVGYLHQGHHFGEVALNEDAPRNATVTSAENNCELLRIERRDYEMAKKIQIQLAKEKAAFLKSIPFFSNIPQAKLNDVAKRCFYESLPVGAVLCAQGSPVDPLRFLPIVHHGEVMVVKRVSLREKKQQQPPRRGARGVTPSPRLRGKRDSIVSPASRFGGVPMLSTLMKNFGLCTMGKQSFFMEESMLQKQDDARVRDSTLIALTHVEILWLSYHYWKTLIMTNDALVATFPTWLFHYPTVDSTRRLWAEKAMWGQFKEKLMEDVVRTSPRSQAAIVALRTDSSITTELGSRMKRVNVYASLPAEHQPDISLPFRLPQDRTKFILNKSLGNDEWSSDGAGAPATPIYKYFPDALIVPKNDEEAQKSPRNTQQASTPRAGNNFSSPSSSMKVGSPRRTGGSDFFMTATMDFIME